MELSQDQGDGKLFLNSIEYLHRISTVLKTPVLKSLYNTKSRLMELRRGIFLPSNVTKASLKCQRCLLNFHDGPAKYSIKKSQKLNKFAKKLKTKEQNGKPLTAYQRKFLKKFTYHEGNTLAIKCRFCEKEASIQLQKPTKETPLSLNTPKKKKKRKDRSCGLNEEILRTIASSKDNSVILLDETLVESNQNDNSVIVVDDSFSKTPTKAKKLASSLNKQSILTKASPPTKTKHKKIANKKSMLKESPRMHKNKHNVMKGKRNKNKGKVIDKKEAKKKNKNLSKLGSLLNNSNKKSPSTSLNHFLQSL